MQQILALEPYYGGSHRAFLDGWSCHSRHRWTVLGLPPHKWKWRMRHGALTLVEQARTLTERGEAFDLIFSSDMLNLAEFRGLAPEPIRKVPTLIYFHENQLTYPARHEHERDLHFGMINASSALAADRVWFNTAFHRESFLGALGDLLARMPDHNHPEMVDRIRRKADVCPQGIETPLSRPERNPGPPRVLWVARWEHDKNPELFFRAMYQLAVEGRDFRLSVIGERFSEVPPVFAEACDRLGARIDRWGYQPSRADYRSALAEADIVVSTARHEFFGVGILEAVAAGATPLLPRRLAYPEVFGTSKDIFYDGTVEQLVEKLRGLFESVSDGRMGNGPSLFASLVEPYLWPNLAPRLDDALEQIIAAAR